MTEGEYIFAFFPYLKTSRPVYYRGLVIRSSDDRTGLPSDAVQHLENLRSMFFLRDNLRIQKMSYAFHASEDETSTIGFVQRLAEFQTLVCFIYSTPHPAFVDPFLRYEHSSLYFLQPKRISKYLILNDHNVEILPEAECLEIDEREEVEGYEGRLNNRSYFWVAKGSRIFPPTVSLWLNISQNLHADLNYRLKQSHRHQSVLEYFTAREESSTLDERILTAITWYNRSIEIDIDEEVALVNLAIAFESLLDLESGEKVTARFKEAVGLLVGGVPRLDSWLIQFYNARSKVIHEGKSQNLMFVAADDPKKCPDASELTYRSLVSYGRQIFRVCVATILTGASLAEQLRLSSLLVTNQQRLERICRALSKGERTAAERIAATNQDVRDVETYKFVSEKGLKIDQLIGTAKLMVQQFLDLSPDEPSDLIEQMRDFAEVDSEDQYRALSLLKEIRDGFKVVGASQPFSPADIRSIVASLIDSVWHYTFMYYFHLERKRREEE